MLNGDVTQERFDRLRYVEIKHGRICMLAFLGQITTRAGLHLPGGINLAGDRPDSFPTAGLVQIVCLVGFLEVAVMKDIAGTG